MKHSDPSILALYLSRYGVSYVYLRNSTLLHDWGTVTIRREDKLIKAKQIFETLRDRHAPDILILEGATTRRASHIQKNNQMLARNAQKHHMRVYTYTRSDIQTIGSTWGASQKHALNQIIATRFPALKSRIPRKRRPWDTESYRQGIFDAAALAIIHLVPKKSAK